ncbi:hypothetical protein AMS68_004544 [Peltaster fructicola]|uniref:Transcription factor domain-containing protein n=1 Tax=Peltaster fructicola TaxID=286661 RepID=A0A6H0XW89_9PEZI|nr:hypothetical protein AMS68_004544 [Peltaster fructicola]
MKTSTPYVLMHAMYSLCQIMLNREYVPFVALACQEPVGPLDEPTFHPRDVPQGFWAVSAEECFKSARDIVDLVVTCRRWSAMVETPFMGFALYITSFVAVYCDAFPWMDTAKHMIDSSVITIFGQSHENSPRVQDIVQHMGLRLPMAVGWTQALGRMRKHYIQRKAEFNNIRSMSMPNDGRKGGTASVKKTEGGGLEDYKQMEHILEFGQLSDGEPPQFELATSRESTTQADKVMTPSPAHSIRRLKATEESIDSTDGRSTTEPEEYNIQQLANTQTLGPTATQQSGTFRIPRIPRERGTGSSSTSPTASSLSTQPSPGHIYHTTPYNTWPAYQQMASNLANNGMNPVLQQSTLASTRSAYEAYPAPVAVTTPATQYIPTNHHMAGGVHMWANTAGPSGGQQPIDPGLGGEDFCAFVEGNSLPDYATRAGSQGQGTWLGELWTAGNDPQ